MTSILVLDHFLFSQDLALDSMVRFGKRQASLESIAAKLKQGAQALKSAANRDNAFFDAVVRLQRFWKVRIDVVVFVLFVASFVINLISTIDYLD